MVSLSTVRQGVPHDPACILYAGDHAFVKHDSYVVYQKARIEEADKVLRGVKSGQLVPQAQTTGADAAHGRDRGGLDGEQASAAVEHVGPVRQVPVGGLAVIGRVLAHGRDHNAVRQGERARGRVEGEGGEKQAHGISEW